jgi:hypothetical protein
MENAFDPSMRMPGIENPQQNNSKTTVKQPQSNSKAAAFQHEKKVRMFSLDWRMDACTRKRTPSDCRVRIWL